ncbi:MAG: MnhB domain-containing protein [Lachnospiraceae bacterium]|jgi:multicomponent Na+:H+ antiporter subunit B|nr:MnhB domain-containing protein [Lachnospiraceae bacterium]
MKGKSKARKIELFVSLAVIFIIGIVGAVRMAGSAPTYDGSTTNVVGLYEDPDTYDTSDADGVANVIVKENNKYTAALNTVYSVTFNFRGYDTMGESFILVGAIAGTMAILRKKGNKASAQTLGTDAGVGSKPVRIVDYRGNTKKNAKTYKQKPVIMQGCANVLLPLSLVYGWYIVLHGAMSPGGGFQGGVISAGIVLLVYLAFGLEGLRKSFHPGFLHSSETVAEIFYICVGLAGIFAGMNFCFNFVFINNGTFREESAMLMNDAVGYHVCAGICCLLIMMLEALDIDMGAPDEEESDIAKKAALTVDQQKLTYREADI